MLFPRRCAVNVREGAHIAGGIERLLFALFFSRRRGLRCCWGRSCTVRSWRCSWSWGWIGWSWGWSRRFGRWRWCRRGSWWWCSFCWCRTWGRRSLRRFLLAILIVMIGFAHAISHVCKYLRLERSAAGSVSRRTRGGEKLRMCVGAVWGGPRRAEGAVFLLGGCPRATASFKLYE